MRMILIINSDSVLVLFCSPITGENHSRHIKDLREAAPREAQKSTIRSRKGHHRATRPPTRIIILAKHNFEILRLVKFSQKQPLSQPLDPPLS